MAILLGCIADDSTGASDLANTLSRNGLRTVQIQGVPPADFPAPDADAVVIALKSRSIEPERAVALSLECDAWLRAAGAGHVMFKVCSTFDSTDRGNIGPVADALRARHGALMPVTPAFPETGRTVYKGNLFVGDLPLNESPLKDHPLTPMRDANLVRVLARQSNGAVGLVELADVVKGAEAVQARLAALAAQGMQSAILDAVFDADLETLGAVVADYPASTGASGLGLGLARALVRKHRLGEGPSPFSAAPVGGKAAMLAGSCSRATLNQIARAERDGTPVYRLAPRNLIEQPQATLAAAKAWAEPYLAANKPFLMASSSSPEEVNRLQADYGREASGEKIEGAMASLAQDLVAAGVRRLVVAGGETSGAVVTQLGIPAFAIGTEIAPGVPVLHVETGWSHRMALALKSGNFGAETFFADALQAMGA